jgi:hypothetical protein
MEKLLKDGLLCKLLEKVDDDLAEESRQAGCEYCGEAKLHRGDYERQPRGVLGWDKRRSFNCANEACRKRKTPPSVRFFGRKVYAGVVVVLVGAMMHGLKPQRVERLRQELGIDRRTLKRWRKWWLENFVQSGFWKEARARFMPRLDEVILPLSLVEAFRAERRDGMVKLLEFLSPITTTSGKVGLVM